MAFAQKIGAQVPDLHAAGWANGPCRFMFRTLCKDVEISGRPLKRETRGSGGDLEPERQRPVWVQVVAGPCNHRNRVAKPEADEAGHAGDVSRCIPHNTKLLWGLPGSDG